MDYQLTLAPRGTHQPLEYAPGLSISTTMWHIRTTVGNMTQVVRHKNKAEVIAALEKLLPVDPKENYTVILAFRVGPLSNKAKE